MNISLHYTEKVCCDSCGLRRITGRRRKDELAGTWGKLRNWQLNNIRF